MGKQLIDKPQQDEFASVFKDNRTTLKLHIGLNLGTFFQKFNGMIKLEFKILTVRSVTEPLFLDDHLGSLGLNFLFLLSLEIKEFIEIYDFANRWIGFGGNFYQVHAQVKCPFHGVHGVINSGFYGFSGNLGEFVKIIAN